MDRNKYQIQIPLPPKIDPTVTMMTVEEKPDVTYSGERTLPSGLCLCQEATQHQNLPCLAGSGLVGTLHEQMSAWDVKPHWVCP